jgi:vacuolar-type H+-ATPase subunit I/STV1
MMLFPKPFIIKKHMEHHAHQAQHDDQHNEKSIPLEEKPGAVPNGAQEN